MAQPYFRKLDALLKNLNEHQFDTSAILCRHFFSGAALYFQGTIFCSKDRDALLHGGVAQPLRYFPKAPVKREYVVLPETVLEQPSAVCDYLRKSIEYLHTGA